MVNRVYPVPAISGTPSYTGRYLRQTTVAPFVAGATAARPLGARSGVRLGTSSTTVTATSTTWTVNPHAGVIDGEAANEAGPYTWSFDAVQTGTMNAAGAFARIDLISVQINDSDESDGTLTTTPSNASIVYTPGTAAAPALPTQPPRSVVIAQINVPASGGGGPSVTWVAPGLVAAGGITPATTAAFGSGTYVGQYIDDPTLGLLRWNGTAWVTPASGVLGVASVTAPQSVTGSTATDLTGLNKAVTVGTGRRLRISFMSDNHGSGAADIFAYNLVDGTTILRAFTVPANSANVVDATYSATGFVVVDNLTAGAHTFKLQIQHVVGSGSCWMAASATAPSTLLIEDLGPAS